MVPVAIWKLLHLFFAFYFVGALTLAEWNGRAARRTGDWGQRASLFEILRGASVAGFWALVLLGVFGNLAAPGLGYRMADSQWMRIVNGLWLVMLAAQFFLVLPGIRRLASVAREAAGGGTGAGFEAALKRWRAGNVVLTLLYLAMLVLMVLHWQV